jgi:hypothetical protein
MPVWATVLVGLGAGVVGTLLSTFLRISHERETELRSRMLHAADDFVAAVTPALMNTKAAIDDAEMYLGDRQPDEDPVADAVEAVGDVTQDEDEDVGNLFDEAFTERVEEMRDLRRVVDKAVASYGGTNVLVVRLQLLFGHESGAGYEAARVSSCLENAIKALQRVPAPLAESRNQYAGAIEHLTEFTKKAREELRGGFFSFR